MAILAHAGIEPSSAGDGRLYGEGGAVEVGDEAFVLLTLTGLSNLTDGAAYMS